MPTKIMNLYHITTLPTAIKILDSDGISPDFSQGRKRVVWYVTKRRITWAIPHVMQRHHVGLAEMAILWVKIPYIDLILTNRPSIYCTAKIFYPITMDSVEVWLQREEKSVFAAGRRGRGINGYIRQHDEPEDMP